MNTYTIETTHGIITAKGDAFCHVQDEITGERYAYKVTKDDELVAAIAPDAFISVVVTRDPSNDITVKIDGRELGKSGPFNIVEHKITRDKIA